MSKTEVQPDNQRPRSMFITGGLSLAEPNEDLLGKPSAGRPDQVDKHRPNTGIPWNAWIIANNSSINVCNDQSLFDGPLRSATFAIEQSLTGHQSRCQGVGSVTIKLDPPCATSTIRLTDVYCCETFTHNILGLPFFTRNGGGIEFGKDGIRGINGDGSIAWTGTSKYGPCTLNSADLDLSSV